METVITRDTDVLREYVAALDARERGFSPFGRLAATVKLAALRRELDAAQIDGSDEDLAALRREVDERINRSFARRFLARRWGARLCVFLSIVLAQQFALAFVWLLAKLFVRFAPVPKRWNPVLPHEQPAFLWVFIFFFFFAAPMTATMILFGGRFLRAWRQTLAATLLIFAASAVFTFLVVRGREQTNPVRHNTSLEQFAKEQELSVANYREWMESNWLLKDARLRRDYETYFRNGPGRWITARFDAGNDAAWAESNQVMKAYLEAGEDENGFRDWLKYYLDRNRIYSEDRIDHEVGTITGSASQRFLGIWQLEPLLNERDRRLYSGYLGSINQAMWKWGIASLALASIAFLVAYLSGPVLRLRERISGSARGRIKPGQKKALESEQGASIDNRPLEHIDSFPELGEIASTPFFDAPFKLLAGIHRSFVRLVVFTSVFVFVLGALVFAFDLSAGRPNPRSQLALMRSHLLFGSRDDAPAPETNGPRLGLATHGQESGDASEAGGREGARVARLAELEQALDEADYQTEKRFKEQYRLNAAQRSDVIHLKSLTSQLEQTTTSLPQQISEVGSRANAAEARAGQIINEATAAKMTAEGVAKQITAKLGEVETRTNRASEQIGKVEDQASVLSARTEALEKELDRRARQIEARTEELGERTAGLKEREERFDRLQRATLTAILSGLKSSVDDLESRVGSGFYRFFNKTEARRDADSLRQRITTLATELRDLNTDQAKKMGEQLDALSKKVDDIVSRIR
ncbi:MAG TPA: hypothetical protein VFB82_14560 [Blastocatellia bacterium]|nr:hypothetical protein [Blastocatellia bacterium]